jgi:hypothetical protein
MKLKTKNKDPHSYQIMPFVSAMIGFAPSDMFGGSVFER